MDKIKFKGNHIEITHPLSPKSSLFKIKSWLLNNNKVNDLEKLLSAPNSIEWLQFYNYKPTPNDLEIINAFFKNRPEVYFRCFDKEQIQFLPKLQKVWFNGFLKKDYPVLMALNKLKGINFGRLDYKLDLTPLLHYKETLTELAFEKDILKKSEVLISDFKKLTSVKFISSKFLSFDFLTVLPIETFSYYGSRTRDYKALSQLNNLKHFRLKTNTSWTDFSFIEQLSEIERIDLFYCSSIEAFPRCSHLTKLQKVIIESCNKLEDITELKKHKTCSVIASGDKLLETNQQYNTHK